MPQTKTPKRLAGSHIVMPGGESIRVAGPGMTKDQKAMAQPAVDAYRAAQADALRKAEEAAKAPAGQSVEKPAGDKPAMDAKPTGVPTFVKPDPVADKVTSTGNTTRAG